MKNIRTIIWDCDNLMWFHKENEPEILADELEIVEKDIFRREFYGMFETFMQEFKTQKVTIRVIEKIIEREMPILSAYNITPEEFLAVKRRVKLCLNDFNPDTLILLKYFEEKNLKNIIKSDWLRESQEKMLTHYGALQYFERLYCCDNAYLKSNPKSISEIIKSGREDEYVIIGDSLTSDICFAQNAGIKSIWFNPQKKKNNTSFIPTFEVNSLLEVMQII